jgi:hypothetical protein
MRTIQHSLHWYIVYDLMFILKLVASVLHNIDTMKEMVALVLLHH